jgi:YqaJ-like viral recombinase domain
MNFHKLAYFNFSQIAPYRKRITASNFGKFCKCKSDAALCNLVRRVAYPQKNLRTEAIKHGKKYESTALEKYEELHFKKCEKSGLVIHKMLPFIAASHDAIIRNELGTIISVIEVKCPYNARSFKEMDFNLDAKLSTSKKVIKFLKWKNNFLFLYESHDYYYQIQSTLFILNLQHADLLVYASDHDTLVVIQVPRNDCFIDTMIHKVANRYFRFYLPEISANRKLNDLSAFFFKDEYFELNIKPMFSFFALKSNISSCPKPSDKYSSAQSVIEALDLIMNDKLAHIIPHQTLNKTVESLNLRKIPARGDGHCILHSWEINTGILQSEIKDKLLQEYLAQPLLHSTFDVNLDEAISKFEKLFIEYCRCRASHVM